MWRANAKVPQSAATAPHFALTFALCASNFKIHVLLSKRSSPGVQPLICAIPSAPIANRSSGPDGSGVLEQPLSTIRMLIAIMKSEKVLRWPLLIASRVLWGMGAEQCCPCRSHEASSSAVLASWDIPVTPEWLELPVQCTDTFLFGPCLDFPEQNGRLRHVRASNCGF